VTALLDYPFHFDGRGRTAQTSVEDHVRDLVEQVLFTAPGERVNRPTFGSGVLGLVFAPGGDAVAAATQLVVQGALHQWLADVIAVGAVDVVADDSTLTVTVTYTPIGSQEQRVTAVTRDTPR
jgi:phage baseplate assembly protein W